jgi:acetyl-CoA C-acetyltransferase
MKKAPAIKPEMVDDLLCGCGLPGGEQGFNLGRVVSVLSGLHAPGCTVNRYCSSSLATTRMAAHAIRAGEGDIFLSVGVECVSRFGNGTSDPRTARNPGLEAGNPEHFPDVYISMGLTAENVAEREGITREEMDQYAVKSQNAAVGA